MGGLVAAWSLRAPFFIYGGLLVVPAVLAAVVLRRAPNHRPAAASRPRVRSLAVLRRAVRNRTYRAAASANLADGFAALGVRGALVPLFVREILHRSPVWTGIGFLLFAALNGAALLPGGRVADALGRRPVVVAGCAISAVGMVMLALLPGLCAYLAALAVAGFGSGLLDVAPAAMIGDIIDSGGGTLVASYQMAGDVGSVVGPVAGGFLVDSASYAAAFGLAAAVLIAAAVLGFISPETRPGGGAGPGGAPSAARTPECVNGPPPEAPACHIASYGYPVVSWAERTIWWHVYPLGFTGAEQAALAPGSPSGTGCGSWRDGSITRSNSAARAARPSQPVQLSCRPLAGRSTGCTSASSASVAATRGWSGRGRPSST